MKHQNVLPTQFKMNYEDKEQQFLSMRSLTRTTFIFGILTFFVSKLLPHDFIVIGDVLIIVYNILLIIMIFLTTLAYTRGLNPSSYEHFDSFGDIAFWSILEAIFFGTGLFFITHYLNADAILTKLDLLFVVLFVLVVASLTYYLQGKIWETHYNQLFTDIKILANSQTKSGDAQKLLAEVFSVKLDENGDVKELSPRVASSIRKVIALRWAMLIVSALVSVATINY